jgi:cystathionine beta-synthase
MILADPAGSILAPYIKTGEMIEAGSWTVEGIGEDFIPPNADLSLVAKAYSIPDRQSMAAARELLSREGILAGSSSGTLLAAALRYCREQTTPKRVVTLVCDSGNKYLSKVFDDFWLAEQGLAEREQHGDLRDLVARSHREGRAGRQPAQRLWPDAARRRVAASRAGRGAACRHHRRKRHSRPRRRGL